MTENSKAEIYRQVGESLETGWKSDRVGNMEGLAKLGYSIERMKGFEEGYLTAALEAKSTGELIALVASGNASNDDFMAVFTRAAEASEKLKKTVGGEQINGL